MINFENLSWSVRNQYTDIYKIKKTLGEIPEQTCPDIDGVIKKLEELRSDNATLRDLGRAWYEKSEELTGVLEDAFDKIDELVKERDTAMSEKEELETKLANY